MSVAQSEDTTQIIQDSITSPIVDSIHIASKDTITFEKLGQDLDSRNVMKPPEKMLVL